MNKLNQDVTTRDQIITDNSDSYEHKSFGDIKHFHRLSRIGLQKLLDQKFANKNDCQNLAPTIRELLDFAINHPEFKPKFSGYAVDVERNDYRVSIDQLILENPVINSRNDIIDLLEITQNSDDIINYSNNNPSDNAIGIWWD